MAYPQVEIISYSEGVPIKITLEASTKTLVANGKDATVITATIRDVYNNIVLTSDYIINFTVNDYGRFVSANPVQAVDGKANITLQSKTVAGTISISAYSPGLEPGTIDISALPGPPKKIHCFAEKTQIIADGVSSTTISVSIKGI